MAFNRIRGTFQSDVLTGGHEDDLLLGGRGDDEISGADGADRIFGGLGDDEIDGGAGADRILGGLGADVIDGGAGEDRIFGGLGDDEIDGGDGNDVISAGFGADLIDGGAGQDVIRTGAGRDTVRFAGDPFNGADVSAAGGQTVNTPDTLLDWSIRQDSFLLNARDLGIDGPLSFVNARAEDLPDEGQNVIALQDAVDAEGQGLNARGAAELIAANIETPGAGVFVYFNANLQINRLVYSSDLSDPDADISILANIETLKGKRAIKALSTFSEDNFKFEDVQIVGDDVANVLVGTDGPEFIDGEGGGDAIIGQGGLDRVSGGAGADIFAFGGADPFDGVDVSAEGRQVSGNEDFISDFEIVDAGGAPIDRFVLDPATFGVEELVFVSVDGNDPNASAAIAGANLIVLTNADNDDDPETPFLATTAADQIAALGATEGPGFFVYFNSRLNVNRLAFSSDLSDPTADLKIVARFTDTLVDGDAAASTANALAALPAFVEGNFALGDVVVGDDGANILVGSETRDVLSGGGGADVLLGQGQLDTVAGGDGADQFAFGGADPFDGVDVSADGRQVSGNEDFIADFEVVDEAGAPVDRFLLSSETFGVEALTFAAVDGTGVDGSDPAALAALGAAIGDANLIVLLNSDNDNNPETPFLATTSADQIAAALQAAGETEARPGFFYYFNSRLDLNRLVFSEDLTDATSDLKIVARLTDALGQDAIDELADFTAANFALGEVVLGDDAANVLTGTDAGEDVIDGGAGDDLIDGLGGSDDLIGGAGADVFRLSGDPFDGAVVDPTNGVREVVGAEDFIADFEIVDDAGEAVDVFQFDAAAFALDELVFVSLDGNAEGASLGGDANLIVLTNGDDDDDPATPFLATSAAEQIAGLFEEGAESRPGVFVYFNSRLDVNRTVYSTDLTDPTADLKILSRLTDATGQDAIDELQLFQPDNFDLFV